MHPKDKRELRGTPRPDVEAELRGRQPGWLVSDLEYARLFDEARESGHYRTQDCASLGEYGVRLGYGAAEALRWADIGFVLRYEPQAEERIRLRRLEIGKLAILKPVYAEPGGLEEGTDWIQLAEDCSPRVLRRLVRRRVEEVRQQEQVVRREILAPQRAWEKFERVKDVGSTRVGTSLSDGQTLEHVCDSYLDRFDPLRRAKRWKARQEEASPGRRGSEEGGGEAGAGGASSASGRSACDCGPERAERAAKQEHRRTGPGRARRVRDVPAPVRHEIWLRANGMCEFPGCHQTRGLELSHVMMFAAGGPHHVRNILLLCPRHHARFDAGSVELVGWGADGRPIIERRPKGDGTAPRPPPNEPLR